MEVTARTGGSIVVTQRKEVLGLMHRIYSKPTHNTEPYLTIGKVAKMTGASCKAIRLYEEKGLIPAPRRRGSYRIYSEQDVFLIHMLKHGQQVGFTLEELRRLVERQVAGNRFPLHYANELFAQKHADLQAQIEALQQLQQRLAELKGTMNQTFGAA